VGERHRVFGVKIHVGDDDDTILSAEPFNPFAPPPELPGFTATMG
jgi:hypothetical protein